MGIRKPQGASALALPEFIGAQTFELAEGDDYPLTFNVSGAEAGDLIVIALSFEVNADSVWSWTGIAFTDIYDGTGTEDPGSYVGYAVWDGTTTSINLTGVGGNWNRQTVVVAVFRNVDTLANSASATGGSGQPDGPDVSGSGRLYVVTGHQDLTSETAPTAPSGWTLAGARNSTGANTSATGIAYNIDGLSDPGAFGGASGAWVAVTALFS